MITRERIRKTAVALLFLWIAGAGLFMAWHDSFTTDEAIHMASGYTILTRHDYRFDPEHTPLFKMLTAVPLLALKLHPPEGDAQLWGAAQPTFYDAWKETRSWSDRWAYTPGNPTDLMKFLARIPSVLSLLMLAGLLYFLTNEWFGRRVAIWTLFFTSFNPTLLAHGHLANDDVAVAAAILFGIALFWRYLQKPSVSRALLVGIGLTIAVGTKFTGLGLIPLFALCLVWVAVQRRTPVKTVGHAALMAATLWLGIWTMYGFHSPLVLTDDSVILAVNNWHVPYGMRVPQLIAWAHAVRLILPIPFLKGLIIVRNGTLFGRGAYLFSQNFSPNLWYYIPAVIALKTQLVVFAVGIVGLLLALRTKSGALGKGPYRLLIASIVVFSALVMNSKLDLGVRYATVVLALAMPFLGLAMARLHQVTGRYVIATLVVTLYAVPVFVQFPNMLSFSSELIQPYSQGWRYMNDSNLDWGQESQAVAQYSLQHFAGLPIAANFAWGSIQLPHYGLQTVNFDPKAPPTETVILVSAEQLSDIQYARFRCLNPIASIANLAFFYRIPQ